MKKMLAFLSIFGLFFVNLPSIFEIYAFADEFSDTREVAIIMYHSILPSKTGQYCITPSMLEEDLLYLSKHGYQSVFISDIINFCEGNASLPDKPIVLSFDDGHYNNFLYAYPILKKYNFKANLNVIGSFCEYSTNSGDIDNPNYSYLTWDEIKTLHDTGLFEIGNHTYKMHSFKPRFGIAKMQNESEEDYKNSLTQDVMKLEQILSGKCGFTTKVFAYPFGEYNSQCHNILKNLGFKAFLTCNEGINHLKKGSTQELSLLKRINRTGKISTTEFFTRNNIVYTM